MTNRQAAVLASRIFCVWFVWNAVSNLAILPNFLSSLQGYTFSSAAARFSSQFQRSMLMNAFADLFRIGINVAAAIFFYRCDAGLLRFFTGGESDGGSSEIEESA